MTSEVVIMNKSGLSLAADSAITSSRNGVHKVYHTANKLFSLTKTHPVGIMVYGSASFMEVPWEVIIKAYRNHLGNETFPNLSDYLNDFLSFLMNDNRFNYSEIEHVIVYRLTYDTLIRIVKKVEEKIQAYEENNKAIKQQKVVQWLTNKVEESLQNMTDRKMKDFIKIDESQFQKKFETTLDEVMDELITFSVTTSLKQKIYKLAFLRAKKDYFSIGSTGFVIAGYGEKDIFPQLLNYRLEGFIFGQLKYKKLKEKTISYSPHKKDGTATITAFAQSHMIESFIGGIEPNMEDAIFGIIDKILLNYDEQIQQHLKINLSKRQVKTLKNMGIDLYDSIERAVEEYKEENYINPLLNIVRALPKEELANMTEALLNLTSFKNRMTRATESVGPPIDVAIITKGDGFVWMKRKDYIDPALNDL